MYWADKIATEIVKSGKFKPYWVDDMKTPSGFAHVGSLRGPIIHSLIFRALKDARVASKFTFVINDFDTVDELPNDLKESFAKYMAFPTRTVPSPQEGFGSYAEYFAGDFKKNFENLGIEAELLSSWDMYHEGKFDGVIREALDNAERIQDIYQKISGSRKKEQGWLPFQVICEDCGKLGTTKVYAWDGKEVSYRCEPNLVTWAQGCGHEGKISPFGGRGKLPWKVDWAAHWKVVGVTIEGAGKDHASAGGSYDIAMALCKEVFKYPHPYKLPYEFFLIGGRKMSSSKGLGLKAHDLIKILPPELGRFLFARSDYREQANFDPMGTMAIPDLFDEYDKALNSFVDGSDETLARIFVLSQIKSPPAKKKVFLPRFREIAQVIQAGKVNAKSYFNEKKGSPLSNEESEILQERIKYAKVWLKDYAPDELKFEVTQEVSAKAHITLSVAFWKELIGCITSAKSPEELEKSLYEIIKNSGQKSRESFQEIYNLLIGKPFGPKLAWLIWENKNKAIKIFNEVSKK